MCEWTSNDIELCPLAFSKDQRWNGLRWVTIESTLVSPGGWNKIKIVPTISEIVLSQRQKKNLFVQINFHRNYFEIVYFSTYFVSHELHYLEINIFSRRSTSIIFSPDKLETNHEGFFMYFLEKREYSLSIYILLDVSHIGIDQNWRDVDFVMVWLLDCDCMILW